MNEVCLAIVILRLHIQGLRTWHLWILTINLIQRDKLTKLHQC